MKTYIVAWLWRGERHVMDIDDDVLTATVGIGLREGGREDVTITAQEYEVDPELKARIWKRIEARRKTQAYEEFFAEVAG